MSILFVAALAVVTQLSQGTQPSRAVHDGLSPVRDAYVAALSEADTAKLAAVYSPSALVASGARFLSGPAEIVEDLRATRSRGARAQLELHPVAVSIDGGLAQEAGTCRTQQNDDASRAEGAYVIVYTHASGEWRIAMEIRCVAIFAER